MKRSNKDWFTFCRTKVIHCISIFLQGTLKIQFRLPHKRNHFWELKFIQVYGEYNIKPAGDFSHVRQSIHHGSSDLISLLELLLISTNKKQCVNRIYTETDLSYKYIYIYISSNRITYFLLLLAILKIQQNAHEGLESIWSMIYSINGLDTKLKNRRIE